MYFSEIMIARLFKLMYTLLFDLWKEGVRRIPTCWCSAHGYGDLGVWLACFVPEVARLKP